MFKAIVKAKMMVSEWKSNEKILLVEAFYSYVITIFCEQNERTCKVNETLFGGHFECVLKEEMNGMVENLKASPKMYPKHHAQDWMH